MIPFDGRTKSGDEPKEPIIPHTESVSLNDYVSVGLTPDGVAVYNASVYEEVATLLRTYKNYGTQEVFGTLKKLLQEGENSPEDLPLWKLMQIFSGYFDASRPPFKQIQINSLSDPFNKRSYRVDINTPLFVMLSESGHRLLGSTAPKPEIEGYTQMNLSDLTSTFGSYQSLGRPDNPIVGMEILVPSSTRIIQEPQPVS